MKKPCIRPIPISAKEADKVNKKGITINKTRGKTRKEFIMNRKCLSVICTCLFLFCAQLALAKAEKTSELTAHWTFDADLQDQIGGNDTYYNGGNEPLFYQAEGKFGGYVEMNATQIHIDGQSFDWTLDESFTISLWMRDTQASHAVILGRDDGTDVPGSDVHWWLGTWGDGTPAFWLLDNNRFGPAGLQGPSSICDNEWHHLAAVHNAADGMLYIYVDGLVQDSTIAIYDNDFYADSPVTLGYLQLGGGYSYAGDIDDLRLYKGALNPDEVKELFNLNTLVSLSRKECKFTLILLPNYPNPFNPSTTIGFTLEKTELAKLYVYNMLGQQVATLLDQEMEAGSHKVIFHANDLPSGVYFYKLITSSAVLMRKAVFMR
ncbi:MAG: T9SS C-terminal target domain-containing protein [Calditrichaeota bacterium]|nr:MAG: T9SS C-terminal target domain-containing protein [Calditrichota bacterium]